MIIKEKVIKSILFVLYTLIVVCIGLATVVEKIYSTEVAKEQFYGSWWFIALWAMLAVAGVFIIVKRRLHLPAMVFHLAFIVILAGALTTHITSREGTIHLRMYEPERAYTDNDGYAHQLPFEVMLSSFEVEYYDDTDAPKDYSSKLVIRHEGMESRLPVSMNNIGIVAHHRLYMYSYDDDNRGITLGMSFDPWGIAITYSGYALLLLGIIMLCASRKTQMHHLFSQISVPHQHHSNRLFGIRTLCIVLCLWLTYLLGRRWYDSGHVPMTNGYETMILMAWLTAIITSLIHSRLPRLTPFGIAMSLLCLYVSNWAGDSTDSAPLMPVLRSPWLTAHVLSVMLAYTLFAIQMLLGIHALWALHRHHDVTRITALSRLMLYPAVFLLSIGIFIGAIWANVSWGTYWSWDPKESWALITMMLYAVPFHNASIHWIRSPKHYHLYIIAAFIAVLFTYFGVNVLLSGMHSYA